MTSVLIWPLFGSLKSSLTGEPQGGSCRRNPCLSQTWDKGEEENDARSAPAPAPEPAPPRPQQPPPPCPGPPPAPTVSRSFGTCIPTPTPGWLSWHLKQQPHLSPPSSSPVLATQKGLVFLPLPLDMVLLSVKGAIPTPASPVRPPPLSRSNSKITSSQKPSLAQPHPQSRNRVFFCTCIAFRT